MTDPVLPVIRFALLRIGVMVGLICHALFVGAVAGAAIQFQHRAEFSIDSPTNMSRARVSAIHWKRKAARIEIASILSLLVFGFAISSRRSRKTTTNRFLRICTICVAFFISLEIAFSVILLIGEPIYITPAMVDEKMRFIEEFEVTVFFFLPPAVALVILRWLDRIANRQADLPDS